MIHKLQFMMRIWPIFTVGSCLLVVNCLQGVAYCKLNLIRSWILYILMDMGIILEKWNWIHQFSHGPFFEYMIVVMRFCDVIFISKIEIGHKAIEIGNHRDSFRFSYLFLVFARSHGYDLPHEIGHEISLMM